MRSYEEQTCKSEESWGFLRYFILTEIFMRSYEKQVSKSEES